MPKTDEFLATLHVLAAGKAPTEQLQQAVQAVFTRFVQEAETPLGNPSAVEASVVELQGCPHCGNGDAGEQCAL